MNALTKALSEVYFNIPIDILKLAFSDTNANQVISMDETILARIVRPRVLVDCNLVGGEEIYVSTELCKIIDYSNTYNLEYLIDVPKRVTAGRSIMSAIGLFSGHYNTKETSGEGAFGNAAAQMMTSVDPAIAIGTARLELIGENKILVTDPEYAIIGGYVKCVIENASNLSNISPRSYLYFSKLVVLAVKAYIHNQLIVRMGKGYIYNGHELSIVNDIITNYESANEDYSEYLQSTWRVVAYHNDKDRLANHINGMI